MLDILEPFLLMLYWGLGMYILYRIVKFILKLLAKPFKKDSYETIQIKAHETKPPTWMKE